MNGMHYEVYYAYAFDDNAYTYSASYALPPTPTLAQISLAFFMDTGDNALAWPQFTQCTYLDQNGVPHTDVFQEPVLAIGRQQLVSAELELGVYNSKVYILVNFFFWDQVF